jgi:hypothetical protein
MRENQILEPWFDDGLFSVCLDIVVATFESGRPSTTCILSSRQRQVTIDAVPLNGLHPDLKTANNFTRDAAMIHLEWPWPIILHRVHKLECKVAHQRSDGTFDFRACEAFSNASSRALAKGHERTSIRRTTESWIRRPSIRVELLRVGCPQLR